MRKKFTMLLAALFLVMGTAWAQTVTEELKASQILPSMGTPENLFYVKGTKSDGQYWTNTTVNTNNQSNAGKFAFYAVPGLEDCYYIYSVDAGKWVNYNKNNRNNQKNFVEVADNFDANAYWKITAATKKNGGQACYQMQPTVYTTNQGGTLNIKTDRYANWYQGADGSSTIGLWQDSPANDEGSAWSLISVDVTGDLKALLSQRIAFANDILAKNVTYEKGANILTSDNVTSIVSSPWTCTAEGKIEYFVDGSAADPYMWHSDWKAGEKVNGSHFFKVDLSAEAYDLLSFSYSRRTSADNDHPTRWAIYGVPEDETSLKDNSRDGLTLLAMISTPFGSKTEVFNSLSPFRTKGFKKFRFYADATNRNRGYFHIGEFQLNGNTIADSNEDRVKQLASAVATAEALQTVTQGDIDALNAKISLFGLSDEDRARGTALLELTGVGYPTANSEARIALQNVVENENATLTDLNEAIAAFKTTTDVTLPEHGKAYQLAFVANDNDLTNYNVIANGTGLSVSSTVAATIFYCVKFTNVDGEERYAFISPEGNFLGYHALTTEYRTHEGNDKRLQNDFVIASMLGVTSNVASGTEEKRFGTVSLKATNRVLGNNSKDGYFILKFSANNKPFDNSSAPYFSADFTSAIKVTEVAGYFANDAVQVAASTIIPLTKGYKLIGEGIGKCTYTFGENTGTSFVDFENLVNAANTVITDADYSLALHMPEDGKYYRIKGANEQSPRGHYLTGNTNRDGGRIALKAEADESTAFRFINNKLVAADNGKYVGMNSGFWLFRTDVSQAPEITFAASPRLDGTYTIMSDRYFKYKVYNGEVELDRTENNGADEVGNDWILEEVTDYITAVGQLANDATYKVYGERGFIYVADGNVKGSNEFAASYSKTDENHHFAILNKDDKYYLYNVGTKKFVMKSGNNVALTDYPEHALTIASVGTKNSVYDWSLLLNNNKVNLSDSGEFGVYTNYEDEDAGNRWAIRRVGTFDSERAVASIDSAAVTINYVLGSKATATKKVARKKGETYIVATPYDYTNITSCSKDGQAITATEGVYSFEVTANTTLTVNLEENLPFTVSENFENAVWYAMQIRGNKYMYKNGDGVNVSTATPTTGDALWAFMGDPLTGITVLNKAAGEKNVLAYDEGIKMKEGNFTWNICVGNGGFMLREGTEGYKYIHNLSNGDGLGYWDDSQTTDDPGSAFVVTTEPEMIALAATAKKEALAVIALHELSDYYSYSDDALATAKAAIEDLDVATDFSTAMTSWTAIEAAMATLRATEKGGAPAVGDFIVLRNRAYSNYLKDNGTNAVVTADHESSTIWKIVEGDDAENTSAVKLQNFSTGNNMGVITASTAVQMYAPGADGDVANFVWENPAEVYAAFKPVNGDYYSYGHVSGDLVGWEPGAQASQWIVTKATTLNVTYNLGNTEAEVIEAASVGQDYTLESPYAFTSISAVTVGGAPIEKIDGVWKFNVTSTVDVVVTLEEEKMPFNTTTIVDGNFAANTEWYVFQQGANRSVWSYVAEGTPNVVIRTHDYDIYDDSQLWCVTGNAIIGYKIYNKVAGAGMSLNNATPAALQKDNVDVWEITNSDKAFTNTNSHFGFKRPGQQYANSQDPEQDGTSALYGYSLDKGSTTNAIAVSAAVEMQISDWKSNWLDLEDGIVGGVTDKDGLRAKIDSYRANPTKENYDKVNTFIDENIREVTQGKFYLLVSADERFYNSQGVRKAIYSNGNDLRWGTLDKVSSTYYWNAETTTRFRNFFDSRYIAKKTTVSADATTTDIVMWDGVSTVAEGGDETSITYDVELSINATTVGTKYLISMNGGNFHANGHGNGGGNEGDIIFWGNEDNPPTVWYVIEVDPKLAISVAALQAKVDELNAIIDDMGTAIGQYKEDDKGALQECIDIAQAVLDGGSSEPDDYSKALTELSESIAALDYSVVLPQAGEKIVLYNKQHKTYLGQRLEGGKLDGTVEPTAKQLWGYKESGYKNCWELVSTTYNEEACYYLYSPYYDWYASPIAERNKGITLAKTQAEAGCYQIEFIDGYFVFNCLNGNDTGYSYLHQVDWTASGLGWPVVDWGKNAEASRWSIELVSAETENKWLETVKTEAGSLRTSLEDRELGEGIGQYSGITSEEKAAALAALSGTVGETTSEKIKNVLYAIEGISEKNKSLKLNMPTAGFYRIKSMNGGDDPARKGKYVQNTAEGNGLALSTEKNANSIMYYDGSTFLSYASGLYLNGYHKTDDKGVICEVGATPETWTVAENAKILGTYALSSTLYGWHMSDWTGNVTTFGLNDENAAWIFEEVTSLPVAISNAQVTFNGATKRVSTLFTPVALEVPTGITAYIGVNEDNSLAMEPIAGVGEAAAIIPANTGVILMADAAGTYNFTISSETGTAIEPGDNIIAGTVAKTIITPAANTTYYVLANGYNGVGLYKAKMNRYDNGSEVPKEKEDGTRFLNNACKAYIPVGGGQNAPALVMRFGRGQGTTEIELPTANSQQPTAVYDLQGRRVLNPTKGMYIINGKKVVIR